MASYGAGWVECRRRAPMQAVVGVAAPRELSVEDLAVDFGEDGEGVFGELLFMAAVTGGRRASQTFELRATPPEALKSGGRMQHYGCRGSSAA